MDIQPIPWSSDAELENRFELLFNRRDYTSERNFLISPGNLFRLDGNNSMSLGVWPEIRIAMGLPKDNPLRTALVSFTQNKLEALVHKTSSNSIRRNRKYKTAFFVGGFEDDRLFEYVTRAAYHILSIPILTNHKPPQEDDIMVDAISAIINNKDGQRGEVLNLARFLEEYNIMLNYIPRCYLEIKDPRAVTSFFELFELFFRTGKIEWDESSAYGECVLDGIKREAVLDVIGGEMRGDFPKEYEEQAAKIEDPNLKEQLLKIEAWKE